MSGPVGRTAGADAAVAIRCPAKLNLCLGVGAPDPAAGGRHPLVSAMLALDFGDDLVAERVGGRGIRLERGWAADAPAPSPLDWPEEEDLAWRAAEAFAGAAGLHLGVGLRLTKRIPCGGGLGGGSADAAGVLVAMDRLWAGAIRGWELESAAAALGSDVLFALRAIRGRGLAAVSGLGELVDPLPAPAGPAFHAALVFPPFGCPTGRVFAALDARLAAGEQPGRIRVDDLRSSSPADGGWRRLVRLGNNLAGPAADVRPALGGILRDLRDAGLRARVTGSGSTLFVPADGADGARDAAAAAARVTGLPTLAVSGPPGPG